MADSIFRAASVYLNGKKIEAARAVIARYTNASDRLQETVKVD